jgi:hypothetical protein
MCRFETNGDETVDEPRVAKLPAPQQLRRVETGAVQFGEDWPGLFIRGDEANAIMFSIRHLQERIAIPNNPLDRRDLSRLTRLADMIEQDVMIRRWTD